MRGIDLTKLAIGGVLAAVLATTACGGDSTDRPAAAATGTSVPATSAAATTPAATTPAGTTPPVDESTIDPGSLGDPECKGMLRSSTATLRTIGDDPVKAQAVLTRGAANLRAEARKAGGEPGAAGLKAATQMEAMAKAAAAGKTRPLPYLEATKNLFSALATLSDTCHVKEPTS